MRDNQIVYLHISTWIGLSIGAIHFYGELQNSGNSTIKLTKNLTQSDITKLEIENRKRYPGDHVMWDVFEVGDSTNCFDTREEIIELGLSSYKIHFPHAKILILGTNSIGDPQEILDMVDNKKMKECNNIQKDFDSFEGYQYKKNWTKAEKMNREWDKIIKEVLS